INEGNIDSALELLRKFLASVPYCNNTDYEGHYQQMMYIMFALLTPYRINVEQHTAKGRTDITLETRNFVYVIELKFGATPQDALQQINRQRYADAFALTGKETVKVGINFEVKDGVMNIDWITE
ncbi:MAG: PD-(D/E)XK nuclease domain-containing protein, partial [Prevotella sp.]|nr:PD-(D/E)XK nuclease domain-containing protein [Prevotella sp.]